MKKALRKAVLCFVCLTLVILSFSSFSWSAQKIIFGTFEPPVGPWSKMNALVAKDLEKATNGKVEVTCSFGGALGKPGEFFDLVKTGIVDMALSVPTFGNPGQFPILDSIALPFVVPTGEIGAQAMTTLYDKGYRDKAFQDVRPLWFQTGQGVTIFTRDKAVRTLDDVKGMKIFAASPIEQEKIKLWGEPLLRFQ